MQRIFLSSPADWRLGPAAYRYTIIGPDPLATLLLVSALRPARTDPERRWTQSPGPQTGQSPPLQGDVPAAATSGKLEPAWSRLCGSFADRPLKLEFLDASARDPSPVNLPDR
ncbi:hypothetical protein ASPACDRAFT_38159 [Aspergillus aculeatus ATCC 16872]|uniref:Uncharacterized protein n=1 Tax=Aspergillus aculeatus (strain ATCC 16872 / CBS 172.66 / WB 5094) TaxID=690307 RepID=A0A1L9X823_ASPA1|nr:uncharacterized protein ASPACDRAFT_38159 [Aspergillus aculeatus ATCC 16872]OJK04597.1 hypothetical protein ASPACDRAFT_38159 [Aspergillus aculeatus ATCC 16872]